MKRLLILGSTGSIGTQALDVVARAGDAFEVVGLSAGTAHEAVVEQARAHGVRRIALSDPDAAARAAEGWTEGEVLGGPEGLVELVAGSDADLVLNAIVGAVALITDYLYEGSGRWVWPALVAIVIAVLWFIRPALRSESSGP